MDSLLSNSQKCNRLADQLLRYGCYTDALKQIDEAINHLMKLKSSITDVNNISSVNIQIEQLDNKKRSIAIKEREDIRKKNKIEFLVQNKHLGISTTSATTPGQNKASYAHGSKLLKDDKSVIEELTTTTSEYKKVNKFLIDEIESLKKENSFLKTELTKLLSSQELSFSESVNQSEERNGDSEEEERSVDLTKYLDDDSSDDNNAPPLEFTVDS